MSSLLVELSFELGKEIGKAAIQLGKDARKQYLLYKARRQSQEVNPLPSAPPLPAATLEDEEWHYEGTFVNDELEGMGKMTSPTKIYTGMFHNGVFHGEGSLEYIKTGRKYVGEFANGTYNGSGVYFGSNFTYSGTFKEGEFVFGLIAMPQGARFEGECENYSPKQGTFFTKRGYKYIGSLRKFTFEGYGKLIFPIRHLETGELTSIVYYEGAFVDGKFNGEGVIVWRNGKKWRGQWADSKMIKTAGAYENPSPEELSLSALASI